ncbi:uncharacterized protein VTP21DRAFT_657 [Calcarisporiella thermophila]|uniref:uncharacterized protein n=1 Tax=Calcarisporiella thermophila TaxID=911321 RepID=UPI003742935F
MYRIRFISKILGESKSARLAVLITLLQVLLVITFQLVIFFMHLDQLKKMDGLGVPIDTYRNAQSLSVYHVLFMVAQIFQLMYCLDAVNQKNTIQIIALAFFDCCLSFYSAVQFYQAANLLNNLSHSLRLELLASNNSGKWALIVVIVIMLTSSLMFMYLAYKMYLEFGWRIYKKIGADLAMRDMYKIYQIFIVLLKFDAFFFLAFSVQYLAVLLNSNSTDHGSSLFGQNLFYLIISFLSTLVTMVMIGCYFLGVRRESTALIIIANLSNLGQMAYFIYELWDVNSRRGDFVGSQIFLTFFSAVCFVMAILTLVVSMLAFRNFNRGLKSHLTQPPATDNSGHSMNSTTALGKRWSIE